MSARPYDPGELFEELLACDAAQRARRLAEIHRQDVALADELASLLQAHVSADGFLGPLDSNAVAHLLDEDDRDQMPETAGSWRLIRELGRGGLGVVYLAERHGEDFDQRAAIKLVKRGMDSDAILSRFNTERRILASLDHPNIARLIDGGVLADGRPWFAMDYVDGLLITDWCDQRKLPIRERLRLFQQVSEAVQAAHASLIVHGDLKPSNILVTVEGQVKLLDFGIAKLLDPDPGHSAALTRVGAVAMTPEYAAPEQIEGRPISVATDVYALGVVLYELLSGRHPYRDQAATRESLQQAVRDSSPAPPSTLAGRDSFEASSDQMRPSTLRRQLRGDLDAIVLTAMARQPEQRYRSVEALGEDIQRHLDGMPVRARARSRRYRASRFLRRHRVSVTAIAGVVAALCIGLGVAIWQAQEASHQAMLAEQSRDFVLTMLKETNPGGNEDGVELRAVDMLLAAADRVEAADDLAPLIQGRLAMVIAEGLLELGSMDRALTLAQLGVDRLAVSRDRDEGLLAEALYVLTRMQVNVGRSDAAEVSAQKGLTLLDQISDLSPSHRLTRIRLLEMRARRFSTQYEAEQAIALRRRALDERIARFGPDHIDVASGHNNLASALHTGGQFAQAEYHYREVGRLLGLNDPDHPRIANVYLGLGVTQMGQGRLDAAEVSLGQAMTSAMAHYGEASGLVTSARMHLAQLRRLQGRFRDAYDLLRQVVSSPDSDLVTFNQAISSSWMGSLALTLDRPADAIDHFERAQASLDALGHQSHSHVMIGILGASLARLLEHGEIPDLERIERVTGDLFEVGAGPGQMHAEGAEILAALMQEMAHPRDAERWLVRARALFSEHFGPDHPRTRAVGSLYDRALPVRTAE